MSVEYKNGSEYQLRIPPFESFNQQLLILAVKNQHFSCPVTQIKTQTHTFNDNTGHCSCHEQVRYSRESSGSLLALIFYLLYSVCFQKELGVMASSATTTPAFQPPHTATGSRSVQTALMSTTAVSDPICLVKAEQQ